ncbi:RNA-directed DNA polymerase, eukaryota, reverse transcriptase zinc-binding domain protein [Tanacetum coccineum]
MEVLNLIMMKNIEEDGKFKYHAGCKDLKITHLCFAISLVKKSLNEFSKYSGLLPNLKKSTVFFGSVNENLKSELLKIVLFVVGTLLMKYLGVPLLAKCLGVNYCKVLIERVQKRIVYLLPKTVVKEINKVMKFLWGSSGNSSGKAKTTWKVVCMPKDQGGLGIKPLGEWNEVLLMKNLWKILGWKKLMELRCKLKPHVLHSIGNGQNTSVWYDKWHQCGPLSDNISRREIYDARFQDDDCVADLIDNGRWKWPNNWLSKFSMLESIVVPYLNENQDKVVWINNNNKSIKFAIKDVWMDLRTQHSKVDWHHIVWFSQCNPRHTFIMWLALHKRLQTHDVMAKWMTGTTFKCSLCKQTSDYVQHLFFQRSYSKKVWNDIKGKILLDSTTCEWSDMIGKIQNMHCKNNIKSILSKVGIAACVYNIWKERNLRTFQNITRDDVDWDVNPVYTKFPVANGQLGDALVVGPIGGQQSRKCSQPLCFEGGDPLDIGIRIDESLTLSHLFYADDVVFIGKWDKTNVITIVNMLNVSYWLGVSKAIFKRVDYGALVTDLKK